MTSSSSTRAALVDSIADALRGLVLDDDDKEGEAEAPDSPPSSPPPLEDGAEATRPLPRVEGGGGKEVDPDALERIRHSGLYYSREAVANTRSSKTPVSRFDQICLELYDVFSTRPSFFYGDNGGGKDGLCYLGSIGLIQQYLGLEGMFDRPFSVEVGFHLHRDRSVSSSSYTPSLHRHGRGRNAFHPFRDEYEKKCIFDRDDQEGDVVKRTWLDVFRESSTLMMIPDRRMANPKFSNYQTLSTLLSSFESRMIAVKLPSPVSVGVSSISKFPELELVIRFADGGGGGGRKNRIIQRIRTTTSLHPSDICHTQPNDGKAELEDAFVTTLECHSFMVGVQDRKSVV